MVKKIGDLKLYSVLDISERLDITDVTIRKYIKTGRLSAQKIGGAWLVSEKNLQAFLTGETVNSQELK
jgi:excisionase family DNA binding protein